MDASTIKQALRSPVMDFDEPVFSSHPPGFHILLFFHSFFGVCYFGLLTNQILKFLTLLISLSFIVSTILFSLPSFLNCAFTWSQLFDGGLSPKFLTFTVIVLDVYHSVMSCVIIGFRSHKLRDFFERSNDYCNTFAINLLPAQRTKLTSVAVKIVFLNILHLVIEVCFLTLAVPQKMTAIKVESKEEPEKGEIEKGDFLFPVVLTIRIVAVIFSKVIESNLIFLIEYLTMIIQRLEMRYDKFVYRNSHGRDGQSIEVGKVAFIEIQNLIKEADEVFAHTAFDPLFTDVLIMLVGVMEFCDGVARRRRITSEDLHDLFNAFVSLISIYMCCATGDAIETEMKEVVQSIGYINAERFTEHDYKSFSLLMTMAQGGVTQSITAGRWFKLNKRFFFWIVFAITGLSVILLSTGIQTYPKPAN